MTVSLGFRRLDGVSSQTAQRRRHAGAWANKLTQSEVVSRGMRHRNLTYKTRSVTRDLTLWLL